MLQVQNISKTINDNKIIDNVSFTINQGEIVALVGPNGSGKTTLLNLISNIINPTEGNIKINSNKNAVSFMQDSSFLYNNLTGIQHLEFVANINKYKKATLNDVVSELEMDSYIKKKVKSYSLGMKQHLMLAIALLTDSEILLLDEPLNGLDPDAVIRFRSIMLNMKNKGFSIIFSSHNLSEVERISDRVLYIKKGRIVSDIKNDVANDEQLYEIEFSEELHNDLLSLLKSQNYNIVESFENRMSISFKDKKISTLFDLLRENQISNEVVSINKQKTTLIENTYKEVYGEKNE